MVVYISTDTTLVKKKILRYNVTLKNNLKEDCNYTRSQVHKFLLYNYYTRSKESWSITRNKKCSMDQLILYNNLVVRELILK